jgi:hypothetical protein
MPEDLVGIRLSVVRVERVADRSTDKAVACGDHPKLTGSSDAEAFYQ